MAGEVTLVAPSMPATAYFVVRNSSGQYWYTVTPAFEAYNAAHWTDYDVALAQDGSSQNYTGTFPSAITTGVYQLSAYAQSGGSPSVGDVLIGTDGRFEWSGTAIVSLDSRVKPADTVARVTLTDTATNTGTLAGAATVVLTDASLTAAKFGTGAITAASIADGAIDAATFAADVDAEILSYLVDDATRIDASSLNTATVTTIPAILVDTAEIGAAGAGLTALATQASVDVIDGNVDGILVDTNELQSDWTNGGRLDLIVDAILDDTGTTGVVLAISSIGSNQLTSGATTELADAFLNRPMPGSITLYSTAYYLRYGPHVAFVSAVTGTPSTTVVQVTGTGGVTTDNFWNDCLLVVEDGDGNQQAKPILSYDYDAGGPTYTFTVDEAFAVVPTAGDVAFVVLTHIHPVSQIQSGLSTFDPTTDTVAHVTLVDTTTTNTDMRGTDNAALASVLGTPAGASVSADIADIPTNAELATAFTEIKGATWATTDTLEAIRDRGDAAWITATGFATPTNITAGTITTVTNLTNAPTNGDFTATMKSSITTAVPTTAQIFAAVLTTQLTEAYAADGTAPTLTQAIMLIQQALTEFAIVGTSLTVKKLDGSTTAAVMTLDSTTPTSTTRSS